MTSSDLARAELPRAELPTGLLTPLPTKPPTGPPTALPRVVGILGRAGGDLRGRVEGGPAATLGLRWEAPSLVVWSSGPLTAWTGPDRCGLSWWPLRTAPRHRRPMRWQDASELTEALGVETAADGSATLHAASLGMQPLYVRRLGTALVFAPAVHDLCDLDDGPLHPDWTAWASVATVGAPLGHRTPFEEIERLPAGTAWHHDRSTDRLTRSRHTPALLEVDRPSATPAEIVALLRESLRRAPDDPSPAPASAGAARRVRRARRAWRAATSLATGATRRPSHEPPWALTLSGGWDSRLLAGCAVPVLGPDRLVAYTTSPDDGLDLDLAYSPAVANALGLRHEVDRPEADGWPAYTATTFDRTDHQTPYHMWLEPLAARLRAAPVRGVVDGLGGDVLLKNLLVDRAVVDAPDADRRGTALWSQVAKPPAVGRPWVGETVAATLVGEARPDFEAEHARLAGHPAEATMTVLLTRTSRCVSLAPFGLFAPHRAVRVPFLDHDVMAAALSVSLRDKANGDFYLACLRAANPALAVLRSTNDAAGGRAKPTPVPLRAAGPAATEWARQALADLAVRQELPADPLPDPQRLVRTWGGRTWLHTLLVLDTWLRRYDGRLAQTRAPWW